MSTIRKVVAFRVNEADNCEVIASPGPLGDDANGTLWERAGLGAIDIPELDCIGDAPSEDFERVVGPYKAYTRRGISEKN
jgi:hypothetical protein